MNATEVLFERVVAASRLSKTIAPFTITRLLVRAGAVPRHLTTEALRAALPELRHGLAVYLDEADVEAALADIETLAST